MRRINVMAVFVAAVVHFGLGAAWFTVFAAPWVAGLSMAPEQVQAASRNMSPLPYFIAFLCNLVAAYVIAWVLARLEAQNAIRGMVMGAMLGVLAATAMVTELGFELRSRPFVLVAAGYPLVGSILMGAILGAWKKKPKATLADKVSA